MHTPIPPNIGKTYQALRLYTEWTELLGEGDSQEL